MLKPYLSIQPIDSAGAAASRYVPLVLLNRVLAFARLLIITRLLGNAGKAEFGLYQPALELTNWFVPLVLFGLNDVIERYASDAVRSGQLVALLRQHRRRFIIAISVLLFAGLLSAPFVATYLLPASPRATYIFGLIILNVAVLAAYQYLLGLLRGLRAYGAAAGMETGAAVLLVTCSALAALHGDVLALLLAYGISNLAPLLFYLRKTTRYCHELPRGSTGETVSLSSQQRFALATFIRLILVMTYGYAVFWVIGWTLKDPLLVAEFAAPWRVAQLLVYLAVTLWSSTYGIMVGHWSRGARKRARHQLTRVGRAGFAVLLAVGCCIIAMTPVWQGIFPAGYHHALTTYLRIMVCIFTLHGMLFYLCMWCDLLERPGLGAALWGGVLIVMAILLLQPGVEYSFATILGAAWAGLAAAVLVFSWGALSVLRVRCDWPIAILALSANLFLIPGYWGILAAGAVACSFLGYELRSCRRTKHRRIKPF